MYRVAAFALEALHDVADLVADRGVGTAVVAAPDGFEASLIPWLVDLTPDGALVLRGHVARGNPLVGLAGTAGVAGLVIVDVVDGYVSPSWYPSKAEHHRVVPTWNYLAVHLHGRLRMVDDTAWTSDVVRRLTDRHEADMAAPWSVDDAPAEFIERMLGAIVGCEFLVERVEGKAKLSQNRPEEDVRGVVAGLAERPRGVELAARMSPN
jgi:transcriptional regulator